CFHICIACCLGLSPRMWLPQNVVALCLSCLVLSTHGRDRVSLRRSNDHTGRCQYTFTVDNPAEASFYAYHLSQSKTPFRDKDSFVKCTVYFTKHNFQCTWHSSLVETKIEINVNTLCLFLQAVVSWCLWESLSCTGRLIASQGSMGCGCRTLSPPPPAQYSNKTVWRIDTVGKDVRQLFAHEDMEQFAKGFPMNVLVLPVESTGATLYRDSLYYQRRHRRTLHRYDLPFESLAGRLELPHAGFHGQHTYSWGVYTDIDLAAKGAIVASQLDPESLEVKRSWETNIRKNTVANTFMISGWALKVASDTAPDTTVNHVFDTAPGQCRGMAVPFKNHYRYNSMVDFNHAQRKLYAWVYFHMITYNVRLAKPSGNSQ
uniref:Myocilin n=1 Tax=Oncorhynchus kisutch TaxID=8019 RepID=A0A8C7H1Z5_ONCKI